MKYHILSVVIVIFPLEINHLSWPEVRDVSSALTIGSVATRIMKHSTVVKCTRSSR